MVASALASSFVAIITATSGCPESSMRPAIAIWEPSHGFTSSA